MLFSGDGDFRRLVEAVQRKGVRVTVVSTVKSPPPMVADELRRQADDFIELAELAPLIARNPSRAHAARRALAPATCRATTSDQHDARQPDRAVAVSPLDGAAARLSALPAPRRLPPASRRRKHPDWYNAPGPLLRRRSTPAC